jgi:hypothetical protein
MSRTNEGSFIKLHCLVSEIFPVKGQKGQWYRLRPRRVCSTTVCRLPYHTNVAGVCTFLLLDALDQYYTVLYSYVCCAAKFLNSLPRNQGLNAEFIRKLLKTQMNVILWLQYPAATWFQLCRRPTHGVDSSC